ncbi:MAG: cysteine desulfurase [Actinomycetota bacterium]
MNSPIDVAAIKQDFPIFQEKMRGDKRLVFLDSGATSQKPFQVLDAERNFYNKHNAAVHRGSYYLAEQANAAYEGARQTVADFLAVSADEIIFTKSATESLNLLAVSFERSVGKLNIKAGDEIVVSELEHHANLLPWQQLAKRTGATLKWFEMNQDGSLDLSNIDQVITSRTKVVAITHQSNVLGSIPDLPPIIAAAHAVGAAFVLDGCQSIPHQPVDIKGLDIDFITFSGHKALGPTGIGVLWGRAELLDQMEPYLYGGSMIETVTMSESTWAPSPRRFEAGVPNMAQAVGLATALEYLRNIGLPRIHSWELELTAYALKGLQSIEGVSVVGPQGIENRGGVISFVVDQLHPHDVGQVMDQYGVAVRTGHHCAWPLIRKLGLVGTTRASFYLYNDFADVDVLLESVVGARDYFRKR